MHLLSPHRPPHALGPLEGLVPSALTGQVNKLKGRAFPFVVDAPAARRLLTFLVLRVLSPLGSRCSSPPTFSPGKGDRERLLTGPQALYLVLCSRDLGQPQGNP